MAGASTPFYDLKRDSRGNIVGVVIDADLFLKVNQSFIVQSPDGNYWKIFVDNDGVLNTEAYTLP